MSYIRSGSNPEKLYIWGDGENATIAEGSKPTWSIPLKVFNGLIKKFDFDHDCPVGYKGAKVEEVWTDQSNNETSEQDSIFDPHLECKVKLSYGENSVIMWDVTWEYIVNGYINKMK